MLSISITVLLLSLLLLLVYYGITVLLLLLLPYYWYRNCCELVNEFTIAVEERSSVPTANWPGLLLRFHPEYVSAVNTMDEVWVPSDFSKEVLASSGVDRAKLVIMPLGVNTTFFDPALHDALELPLGRQVGARGRGGGGRVEAQQWGHNQPTRQPNQPTNPSTNQPTNHP